MLAPDPSFPLLKYFIYFIGEFKYCKKEIKVNKTFRKRGRGVRDRHLSVVRNLDARCNMPRPLPQLISRREAWQLGHKRYFTGKPCQQGHITQRYVSSGACLDCLNPYKFRAHPFDKNLVPYECPKLWAPNYFTVEQYLLLEKYLQQCIDAFAAVNPPPLTRETATCPHGHRWIELATTEVVCPEGCLPTNETWQALP